MEGYLNQHNGKHIEYDISISDNPDDDLDVTNFYVVRYDNEQLFD